MAKKLWAVLLDTATAQGMSAGDFKNFKPTRYYAFGKKKRERHGCSSDHKGNGSLEVGLYLNHAFKGPTVRKEINFFTFEE